MHSNSGPRRRHSAELKAKVLAACSEPGASISGIALAHGLNANLVHKWRSSRGLQRSGVPVESLAITAAPRQPIPACKSSLHRPGRAATPLQGKSGIRRPPLRSSTSNCAAVHCT